MNCDNVINLLDEYVDGELAESDRRNVEAHVAGCALCAEGLEALEREQNLYSRYSRPVETGDAMWTAIRGRIEPGTGSSNVVQGAFGSRRWMAPLVAAACLAIVGTAAFVAWRERAPGSGPVAEHVSSPPSSPEPQPVGPTILVPTPAPTSEIPEREVAHATPRASSKPRQANRVAVASLPVPVADAERRYIAAIALLRTEIDRTAGADPSSRETARKPLTDLDANIQTARRAVEQNPDDPIAVNSMLSAYDEKVETMQRLVALQARNDR